MLRYSKSPQLAIEAYKLVAEEHRRAGETELAERADSEVKRLESLQLRV